MYGDPGEITEIMELCTAVGIRMSEYPINAGYDVISLFTVNYKLTSEKKEPLADVIKEWIKEL